MNIYFYLSIMLFVSVILLLIKIKELEAREKERAVQMLQYSKMCQGYFESVTETRKLLLASQKREKKLLNKSIAQDLHIKKMSKDKHLYCSSTEFRRWTERTGHKI